MQPKNKNTLRDYFTFSARERKAIYLLLILTAVFFLLPHFFPAVNKPRIETVEEKSLLTKHKETQPSKQNRFRYPSKFKASDHDLAPARLFYFDPNKATLGDWQQLGVKEKTAQTILRYIQKGGRFRSPEDLKKIWGLSPELAERLIPFVLIATEADNPTFAPKRKDSVVKKSSFQKPAIDVNAATQEQWESLRGVGPGLASRIIRFREKLGGFISVEQVKETYGLPDSTFQQIKSQLLLRETTVIRLNINELGLDRLAGHPYIRYPIARAIIAYRAQHGAFQSVQDLQKIISISPETYHKIEKYLTVH